MTRIISRLTPAVVLYFLSSFIAELLTGNMPPVKYFHPLGILLMMPMYGLGAIAIRELMVRWGKGWPSLLVMGAVYGILEEALACNTFFNPVYPGLSGGAAYGRWLGVNWVWALGITTYHAFVSIGMPILLVELCFPRSHGESWIGTSKLRAALAVYAVDVAVLTSISSASGYSIPLPHLLLTLVVVAALVMLARRLPESMNSSGIDRMRLRSPLWFGVAGAISVVMSYVLPSSLQLSGVPASASMLVIAVATALMIRLVWRASVAGVGWTDMHRLALASGALVPYIAFTPVRELAAKAFPSPATGMGLVGVSAAVFLVLLRRRVATRASMEQAIGS